MKTLEVLNEYCKGLDDTQSMHLLAKMCGRQIAEIHRLTKELNSAQDKYETAICENASLRAQLHTAKNQLAEMDKKTLPIGL